MVRNKQPAQAVAAKSLLTKPPGFSLHLGLFLQYGSTLHA